MVGVLGEVLTHQDVEQVGVAAEVSLRERDQLAVTGRTRLGARPMEMGLIERYQGGDDEQGGIGARGCRGHRLVTGRRVTGDQPSDEVRGLAGLRGGGEHGSTISPGADGALTATDGERPEP